ncbi:MAG TPA: PDZ domain-containing protein [Phycisphaerae bacterium]|nr:PDZ domain-containing protein [Phycisphaerae bacterium]
METQNTKRKAQNIVAVGLMFLAGGICLAQNVRPDLKKTKSSNDLRSVFDGIAARGNESTVTVRAQGSAGREQVAFGTVVSDEGYILTKASEVVARKDLKVAAGSKEWPVRIVGVSEPLDLAMLKVDGDAGARWKQVEWADLNQAKVEVGEWVATCGPAAMMKQEPVAVGVVSVGRRKIAGQSGFLGVMMGNAPDNGGAAIEQVITGSAAEKAGVKVGDTIIAVGGKPVHNGADLKEQITAYHPGDAVVFTVRRAKSGQSEDLQATLGLGLEEQAEEPSQFSMEKLLGGAVSKRASDFASVFQHDTVIRPVDCGGPIVDLSGKVIGINIARAGRTETYALPADIVVPMIEPLESGRLAPVNANASSTRPKKQD